MFSWFINWASNIKNKFLRKILELITGIDKRLSFQLYNSETFTNYFKKNNNSINIEKTKR